MAVNEQNSAEEPESSKGKVGAAHRLSTLFSHDACIYRNKSRTIKILLQD